MQFRMVKLEKLGNKNHLFQNCHDYFSPSYEKPIQKYLANQ